MVVRRIASLCALSACVACGSSNFEDGNDGGGSNQGSSGGGFGNVGNDLDGGPKGDGGNCSPDLTGLVRDFQAADVPGGHPDFEKYGCGQATTGLVQKELGADHKPVFASTNGSHPCGQQITSQASFDQWYHDVPGVNQTFEFSLPLKTGADGIATYNSNSFFPIDGKGFGNSGRDDKGVEHNFGFTFELHLQFVYRGGESFTFTGDDDLWTFFNNKLGIDLGGLHPAQSKTVKLDEVADQLGITKGNTYPLDVFQAERHTKNSNFRIDTTLEFVNCSPIIIR